MSMTPRCNPPRALLQSAGAKVSSIAGDITSPGFADAVIQKMIQDHGAVDILVNNASYTWDNVIQKTTDEQFQAMLDIHVVAPFRLLRAASSWIRDTAKKEKKPGRQQSAKW